MERFQKEFYEDLYYMTRAYHGIVPVGVKCKMEPIDAEKWLSSALDQMEEATQEIKKGETWRKGYEQGYKEAREEVLEELGKKPEELLPTRETDVMSTEKK